MAPGTMAFMAASCSGVIVGAGAGAGAGAVWGAGSGFGASWPTRPREERARVKRAIRFMEPPGWVVRVDGSPSAVAFAPFLFLFRGAEDGVGLLAGDVPVEGPGDPDLHGRVGALE